MNDGVDLLLEFLHTVHDPDVMASPAHLFAWLESHGLVDPAASASEDDVRTTRRLRAALIALLAEQAGAPGDARTRTVIAAATEAAPLRVTIADDGKPVLAPSGQGVPAALARLAAALYAAGLTGRIERMKVCRACGWPFYDASKNRSRVWCDMKLCGSRQKARTYRERRAVSAGQNEPGYGLAGDLRNRGSSSVSPN